MNHKTCKQLKMEPYVEHGVAKLRCKQPLTKEMFREDVQYSPGTPNWVLHSLTSDWYSTHFELMSEALWMHSLYVVGVLTRFCSLVSAMAWIGSKRRMTAIADFITLLSQQGTVSLSRLLGILLLQQLMESSSQQQPAKPWLGWTILVRVVCLPFTWILWLILQPSSWQVC